MSVGYIYILSNPSIPGMYKVGYTLDSPNYRAAQLFTTSVPEPFIVEYYHLTGNVEEVEREVHDTLKRYRHNSGREFFRVAVATVVEIIEQSVVQPHTRYLRIPIEAKDPLQPNPPLCRRCGQAFERTEETRFCPKCGF